MNTKLRYFIKGFIFSLLGLCLAQLLDQIADPWYQTCTEPLFWILGGIACVILAFCITYFTELNPRKFYHFVNTIPTSIFVAISTICLPVAILPISMLSNLISKIVLLVLLALLFLFLFYMVLHRGVCVYEKGIIRIFEFKVKTYRTRKIDDISFDYIGKKCIITITICGCKEQFNLSSFSAKSIEKRIKNLIISN